MYNLKDLFDMRSVVGANLESILSQKSLTKAKFCSLSGISRPTLDKLLSGNLTSKTNYDKHIAKVLNSLALSPDALLGNVKNKYNRSRTFRNILNISTEVIAKATGISPMRLEKIEAGGDATLAELRDIAIVFSTGVKNVLGTNYFETQVAMSQDVLDPYYKEVTKEMHGFWGHIGILPSPSDNYLWFPITIDTYELIYRTTKNNRMVIPCMNNVLLFVNTNNISKIVLLDDACDAPSFGNWNPSVSCGEIPLVVYDALADYLYYKDSGEIPPINIISDRFLQIITDMIDTGKLDIDEIASSIDSVEIYYKNGNVEQTDIDFNYGSSLISEIASVYDFEDISCDERFLQYADNNGADILLNFDNIALIQIPLLRIEDAILDERETIMADLQK